MEYFDTLPVEVGKDGDILCKERLHVLRKMNRDCL